MKSIALFYGCLLAFCEFHCVQASAEICGKPSGETSLLQTRSSATRPRHPESLLTVHTDTSLHTIFSLEEQSGQEDSQSNGQPLPQNRGHGRSHGETVMAQAATAAIRTMATETATTTAGSTTYTLATAWSVHEFLGN